MNLTHEIAILPESGRHDDVEIHMAVRDDHHEVALVIGTGWASAGLPYRGECLEVHSTAPLWEDQASSEATECPRGWAECYFDGRDGLGYEGAEMLRSQGSDAVWFWLEEIWHDTFGGAK